jgi:hypothetical protein
MGRFIADVRNHVHVGPGCEVPRPSRELRHAHDHDDYDDDHDHDDDHDSTLRPPK